MRVLLVVIAFCSAEPALADGAGPRRGAIDRGERVIRSFDTHQIPAELGPRRRANLDIMIDGSRGEDRRRPERRPPRRYAAGAR
jgi:hypothetical protein